MRILRKSLTLVLAFGLSVLALNLVSTPSVSAESENTENYVYTAKSGDSYTELSRSSIIKFDQENDEVELDAAQVTAAETWVTQAAGSPAINVGQQVSVSKASVEKFAKQADSLDEASIGRWKKYADASSISNTELNQQVLSTTSEDKAKGEEEQKQQEQANQSEESKTEEKKETKASRRWVVLAIVLLLVLAAVTLIRSSNQRDE